MSKFKEYELIQKLHEFQNPTNIELEFEKDMDGKIILENATVKYDSKLGFINIESKNVKFKINTTLVYGYEIINDVIQISLESLVLKIKKCK